MPQTTRILGRKTARSSKLAMLVAAMTCVIVAALVLIAIKPTELLVFYDPGEVVRSGYTFSKLVSNIAASVVLGSALAGALILPEGAAASMRIVRLAGVSAVLWMMSSVASSVFTYVNVSGQEFSPSPEFLRGFFFFSVGIELGQAWAVTIGVAAVIATASLVVSRPPHFLALGLLALIGLVPLAQQGHASGAAAHFIAVSSILMHVVFAALWVGTLLVLLWVRANLPRLHQRTILRRFSTLALVSFLAVAFSGLINASLRIASPEALFSSAYGPILLGKALIFLILGGLGFAHRRWLLKSLGTPRRHLFWAVVSVEIVLMGVAFALAAVLARTAPPGSELEISDTGPVTPAEALTGDAFVGPLTAANILQTWRPDPAWIFVGGAMIVLYALAVRRGGTAGIVWPRRRHAALVAGTLILTWATNGALSVHATQSLSSYTLLLVVAAIAGILIGLAKPFELAAAVVQQRTDNSWGTFEYARALSVVGRRARSPIAAATALAILVPVSIVSPAAEWLISDPIGRGVAVAAWALVSVWLAESVAAGSQSEGNVRAVTMLIPLAGVAVTIGALGAYPIYESWFATINPGGIRSASQDQASAVLPIVALGGLALTYSLVVRTAGRSSSSGQ